MSLRARVTRFRDTSVRYLRLARWLIEVERQLIGHAWQYAGVVNAKDNACGHLNERADEKAADFARLSRAWAQALVQLMQENGGTWVKVGQFLSCRPDILPPEFIEVLSTLQTSAKPVPFEQIYPVLTAQWGNQWEQQFSMFDVLPCNTASIAQVYKAQLVSGETVAVKVLLPGVAQTFELDARLLRWMGTGLNRLLRGFDWVAVIEQFIMMTQQEFDLSVELANIQAFHAKAHVGQVVIPDVFPDLSGPQVLVMSWLDGEPLGVFLERAKTAGSLAETKQVLAQLARLYVKQISQNGLFHADPHPGNLVVTPNLQLGLLDFGAVGRLTSEERVAFNGLLAMLFGYQSPQFELQLKLAGFRGVDAGVMARLSEVIRASASAEDFSTVLETVLDVLRNARVEMPDAFVAVIRVLITVSGYLSKYDMDFQHFRQVVTEGEPASARDAP